MASKQQTDSGQDLGASSQWELIRRRFAKHHMARLSLYLLGLMYATCFLAEFFAPYSTTYRNNQYAYAPAQAPQFSFKEGFYVYALTQNMDTVTYRKWYQEDRTRRIPLGFFVKGEPYRLWGLVTSERRLFGVDLEAYNKRYPNEPAPCFYFMGGDQFGHDLFSRMIYGGRISLSIGLVGISISFVFGIVVGGLSGYLGGRMDVLIQRLMEIINSFPSLPLWLGLAAIMPADWSPLRIYFGMTIVLALLSWTPLARVVRGKILSLREEDYAVAARLLGAGHARIIFKHLLPGFTSHIIVALTLSVPAMILGETALSFLGVGLRPPVVSWGVLLRDCMNMQVVAIYPWILLPVGLIVVAVLCFNFLGDGLRDAADPYATN